MVAYTGGSLFDYIDKSGLMSEIVINAIAIKSEMHLLFGARVWRPGSLWYDGWWVSSGLMIQKLYNVPVYKWILRTIRKMADAEKADRPSWTANWRLAYRELGGMSEASAARTGLVHAAYGLWRLGLINGGGLPTRRFTLPVVNEKLGKDTACAVIALSLLQRGWPEDNKGGLWHQVQVEYEELFHTRPPLEEVGQNSVPDAVSLAVALFSDGHSRTVRL